MKRQAWLERLAAQLPGWHVWYWGSGGSIPAGYCAVPAPADVTHDDALTLPGRMGPVKGPAMLRKLCRERYGWNDVCSTCDELARVCGHRAPGTTVRGDWCETCNAPARRCGHRGADA